MPIVAGNLRTSDRGPLAVFYEPRSVDPMQLVASGAGRWELLWIVDEDVPAAAVNLPLLRRFGSVVNVTGMSPEDASDEIAPYQPAGIVAFADEQLMSAALIAQR